MIEETNNGNDIQSPDNVGSTTGDGAELPIRNDQIAQQLDSADLGASKPVPVPEQTQRPLYLPTVVACEHKLDTRRLPVHANCFPCWEAFFETNAQHLGNVHQTLMAQGSAGVIRLYGSKFTKMFGKYLQKQMLQQAEPQVQGEHLEVPSITAEGGIQ